LFVPRTDLNDQRSDKNKLVVSAAVEAKMPFAAAAAMAWPEYKAGETMTLSELAATSGDDIALPVGEWVCLGLCLSTTSGVGDNDRTHYLALKLVRVGPDAFTVCVCDGIGTDGILRELEAARVWGGAATGIYVAFGLHVDSQLFTPDFARECSANELQSMNLGHQRGNVCAFNTVYALLALNLGLCEMLGLGGALSAGSDDGNGARAMAALQHCVLTSLFGPANGMEQNNQDFVAVIERSIRSVDGILYSHETAQDAACLMHDVLWVLWGKLKQGDWGNGRLSMCDSGKEYHRMVLMGKSEETATLNHVSAAHIVESWMFTEMALSVWIAVQYKNRVVCPVDWMQHANIVYKHLASWVGGGATTVPAEVSNSLCQITSGGESKWPLGWFFAVLTCKCGHTFEQGVWSCNSIESYTPEAVVVVKSIVSLLSSTARKMENMDSMQLCSNVLDELAELPADPADVSEADSSDDDNVEEHPPDLSEEDSAADANLDEEETQAERDRAATQSQVTSSASKKGRTLDAKYGEVWEDRKLLLTATFFPMSHEETTAIMHCATQAEGNTRKEALQGFLTAQVKVDTENELLMSLVDTMLHDAKMHIRHIALDKIRIDKSMSFIDELACSGNYAGVQQCILGQFRSYPNQMVGMADGKQLFEADADDHGFLYLGMCSLFAAPQAVLAGMVVADDKEPKWAEDGAALLAGSKAYRQDWHEWMAVMFGDDQSVPPIGGLAEALAKLLDNDSAAAVKRDFRLQTVGDSNGVEEIATAIAATAVLVESADTDDLDSFAQPFQMDGHRKAISGASTEHAVPQVVGILRPEMDSPEHRVVVMQQQKESPSTIIRTAPWSLAPGGRKGPQAVVVESDSVHVTLDTKSGWAPGDSCMSAVLRFTESGWLTGTRIAMEKLRNLNERQLKELKKVAKEKGVWLEHRTKGKLADANRTYWLVDDQELAAFLPEGRKDEPVSVAEPEPREYCPNAQRGCAFVGSSINSLNAHARFCNYTKKVMNQRDVRAAAPTKKASTGTKAKGQERKAGNKRAMKISQHKDATSADAEPSQATRKQQRRGATQQGNEPFDVDPERAMAKFKTKVADAQQVMHSCWWCGGDCACAD
jgi:hypothetical protein